MVLPAKHSKVAVNFSCEDILVTTVASAKDVIQVNGD